MSETRTHPRLGHLLETSIYVTDLDRAQFFYQRVFGFELFLRDDRMAGLAVPPHDGGGSVHLCFAIPLGELAAWEAHLRAERVPVESRITWPRGGTSLYIRDPDNSLVELATPGLWPSW
jgi:catechol 2,3-dioxygenase-like lactoylglutathione lyase family enzyme